MHVKLTDNFQNMSVDVTALRRRGGTDYGWEVLTQLKGGGWAWQAVPEGQEANVTVQLPRDLFEALVRESGQVTKATDVTLEALADTRHVRDRLLTLVERTVNGKVD